jgi:mediator of RNA polymerase II transcription subunit 16
MYQNELTWHSTSARLATMNSSHDLLSHAAMGQEGSTLLLVTHDLGKRFRLYKITIKWNPMQHPTTQGAPPNITVAPTLEIGHLTMLEHVAPQQHDTARLSDLQLLPRIPPVATEPGSTSLPTVLAVFTRATVPAGASQQAQEAFSVMARWNVETVVPTLHEAFAKLKVNGKVNGATQSQNPITVLRRQEDNFTNKLVLAVEQQYYGTMLAFVASDGSIEFRDRINMTSIEPYGDTTIVSSLPHAGFEQMMTEHNPHVAMSADGSAMGMIKTDGSLVHKMMTLRYSWQPLEDGISDTQGLIEAAIVCLARQHTILSCSNTANDETLALIPFDLSTDLRILFIKEIIMTMNRFNTLDISMHDINKQQMIVIREPLLPRALSAQFVTGTKPGTMERDFAGKFAYAFLNARVACTAIAQLITRPEAQVKPDFLISLRGNIKWGCDVLVYITNYLVNFKRKLGKDASSLDAAAIAQAFTDDIAQSQSPVLHLLLCTWTRCYIRFLNNFIPKYLGGTFKITAAPRSVPEKQVMEDTYKFGTSLPFKFSVFEPFIAAVDTAVREAYTTQSVPAERRGEIELNLVTGTAIPPELHPAIKTLMDTALPNFMQHIDFAALYFRDTSWTGIEPTSQIAFDTADVVKGSGTVVYDVIRKLPLAKGTKLRRCRRCPAVMEDLTPERARELPTWFTHAQRHCVCGNYWIL